MYIDQIDLPNTIKAVYRFHFNESLHSFNDLTAHYIGIGVTRTIPPKTNDAAERAKRQTKNEANKNDNNNNQNEAHNEKKKHYQLLALYL